MGCELHTFKQLMGFVRPIIRAEVGVCSPRPVRAVLSSYPRESHAGAHAVSVKPPNSDPERRAGTVFEPVAPKPTFMKSK